MSLSLQSQHTTAAICPVNATTTFPTVMVTDAFVEGLPKHVAWDMMSFKDVNYELKQQVTSLELELNKVREEAHTTTHCHLPA